MISLHFKWYTSNLLSHFLELILKTKTFLGNDTKNFTDCRCIDTLANVFVM